MDEVYQDELEGTGHVSDADAGADAATFVEDLDNYVTAQVYLLVVEVIQHGRVRKKSKAFIRKSSWTCQQQSHA